MLDLISVLTHNNPVKWVLLHSHLIDEEIEAQKDYLTRSRSHSNAVRQLEVKPRHVVSVPCS